MRTRRLGSFYSERAADRVYSSAAPPKRRSRHFGDVLIDIIVKCLYVKLSVGKVDKTTVSVCRWDLCRFGGIRDCFGRSYESVHLAAPLRRWSRHSVILFWVQIIIRCLCEREDYLV